MMPQEFTSARENTSDRSLRAPQVGALAAAASVVAVAWVPPLTRSVAHGPITCPFLNATGWQCPLCGLTRGTVAVVRGRWSDAVSLNPYSFLVIAAVALGLAAAFSPWVAQRVRRIPRGAVMVVSTLFGLSLAVFFVARNLA